MSNDVHFVRARSESYKVVRGRIFGPDYGLCDWCDEPAIEGTVLTRTRWVHGRPIAGQSFLCDGCYLAIHADDIAWIATHIQRGD